MQGPIITCISLARLPNDYIDFIIELEIFFKHPFHPEWAAPIKFLIG